MAEQAGMRFETLIERYHDEIYRYLWQLLASSRTADDAIEAQDLTQEVFLRAYQALGRVRPGSNYRAWLYKIATNCAYTLLKRSQRHITDALPEEDDFLVDPAGLPPAQQVALQETQATLQAAITLLPVKQQAAVIMRYLHELSYEDIAEALNCSLDSARANVYQATRRLRRELEQQAVVIQEVFYE
jgi:RNA polymerase sigma-70 factor (ECF subfamily)